MPVDSTGQARGTERDHRRTDRNVPGEAVDERACLEFYRNTPREVAPEQLIADLCVPLRAPPQGG